MGFLLFPIYVGASLLNFAIVITKCVKLIIKCVVVTKYGRITQYIAHESSCTLETTLNQEMERLPHWFTANYLQVNATKTQAMTLRKSQYPYNIFISDKCIEIE